MKYAINSMMFAGFAWLIFVSILRADSPASIEIVGVKLTDKNQITVELGLANVSDKNINIYPKPWVKMASLNGHYYNDDPMLFKMTSDYYRPAITIYVDGVMGNWPGNFDYGMAYHSSPLVLKPGERKQIFVSINMGWLLHADFKYRDFMTTLSHDILIRGGLYESGGRPTSDEEQELEKERNILTQGQFTQVQEKLLNKYAPVEITHGDLYKLEAPKVGDSSMVLLPIKARF